MQKYRKTEYVVLSKRLLMYFYKNTLKFNITFDFIRYSYMENKISNFFIINNDAIRKDLNQIEYRLPLC